VAKKQPCSSSVNNNYKSDYDPKAWKIRDPQKHVKGTVQRKLTGVESDINRKVFLSH
jgi:hypothetical protein